MKYFAEASPYCKELGKRKRIRKSASRLSDNEKSKLRKALELAILNGTEWMNFPDIANFHGAPYNICQDRYNHSMDPRNDIPPEGCCPHTSAKNAKLEKFSTDYKDFLPWHRLILGITVNF